LLSPSLPSLLPSLLTSARERRYGPFLQRMCPASCGSCSGRCGSDSGWTSVDSYSCKQFAAVGGGRLCRLKPAATTAQFFFVPVVCPASCAKWRNCRTGLPVQPKCTAATCKGRGKRCHAGRCEESVYKKTVNVACSKIDASDASLTTLKAAEAKCTRTRGCAGIFDAFCNGMYSAGDAFALCTAATSYLPSKSCVFTPLNRKAPAVPTAPPGCKDEKNSFLTFVKDKSNSPRPCAAVRSLCSDNKISSFVQKSCPATCGTCAARCNADATVREGEGESAFIAFLGPGSVNSVHLELSVAPPPNPEPDPPNPTVCLSRSRRRNKIRERGSFRRRGGP